MKLNFGKFGTNFVIINESTGVQLEIERGAAKALARFLMIELNITKAFTNEGMAIHETDAEFRRLLDYKWGKNVSEACNNDK